MRLGLHLDVRDGCLAALRRAQEPGRDARNLAYLRTPA